MSSCHSNALARHQGDYRDELEKCHFSKKLRAVEIDHVTQRKERPQSLRGVEYQRDDLGLERWAGGCSYQSPAHDGNSLQPLAVLIVREGWRTEMSQKDSLRLSDWLYMGVGGRGKRHQNVLEVTLGV